MSDRLSGTRIAFLATDGVEQVELTEPLEAARSEGAETGAAEPGCGDPGDQPSRPRGHLRGAGAVADADPADFDGLVLPGGVANPDRLRADEDAVAFVRAFFDQDKPVGAICHGPWTIVEAGVGEGPHADVLAEPADRHRNAGGHWVDEQVHVDGNLVTSRKPDDLPAFCKQMVEMMARAPSRS